MAQQTAEQAFENELCAHVEAHGWLSSPDDTGYDAARALYPEDVFAWLADTQPDELAKKVKPGASPEAQAKARAQLLDRLAAVLDKGDPMGGTLAVLRGGFKDVPAAFTMMQRRPETALNADVNARYAANRLRVMRQVHYSVNQPRKSLDLVLFVNGIPVATVELKTAFTQHVDDAKRQYQNDRPPGGEPLLGFGTRALVHFAVSNDEVWMTTRLAGKDTRFLPFNRGNDGAAGNAPDPDWSSPAAYLWRDVWQRDAWLDILGKFIHYEHAGTHATLIFPRFHQWDAVTRLVGDARTHGPGQRYLVQHSAGSGKTRTIAWTAHRLATLHRPDGSKVFDSVIVVTDRTMLDAQLQDAVRQIETRTGIVAAISTSEAAKGSFTSKSAYLEHTLASGALIIVATIQTFPFVLDAIREDGALSGRSFAVIADEAHSSQTGMTAAKLKLALSDAELADVADGGDVDIEAFLAAEAAAIASTPNISFLAFTATPKTKTMELFGTPGVDDLPHPFHLYTMRQAIEEHFILDVLANYTTYSTAFELARNVEGGHMAPVASDGGGGERVDESAATKGLMRWVKLHPTNIAQKVEIIVEHFRANVRPVLGGRAKAMVVTDSRKAAVRYKQAMDAYIAAQGLDLKCLVAFSGEVRFDQGDPDPPSLDEGFTEGSMNPGAGDLRAAFAKPEHHIMIVANKFQTGFDQPLLCGMYVDRPLAGVAAVQTLSRLNRYVPGKTTAVLDFVNAPDDILAAFRPYYEAAEIEQTTDPNMLHDLGTKLDTAGMYDAADLDAIAHAYVTGKGNNALAGLLAPIKHRYVAALTAAVDAHDQVAEDALELFRKDVASYVKLYDFLSQIVAFGDTEVAKRAIVCRLLAPQLRPHDASPTVDLSEVQLVAVAQTHRGQTSIDLAAGEATRLRGIKGAGSGVKKDPRMVLLDEVLDKLNDLFAAEGFTRAQQRAWLESLVAALAVDPELRAQAQANSEQQFLASPTLRDAAVLAVTGNEQAQARMAELFGQRETVEDEIVEGLGRLLYQELRGE